MSQWQAAARYVKRNAPTLCVLHGTRAFSFCADWAIALQQPTRLQLCDGGPEFAQQFFDALFSVRNGGAQLAKFGF